MSRRPQTESRTEQNRNTLKQLVKLEANKSCADCKKNKHPRWASWNLGVFICSGIHRGMGTHISRVKSVDLDTWTDEQLQSMLRWGNSRANKYWEAKLASGHVPSESKIENFIRTKYESKRWVMEGPMPDPATLDVDGDDDVPLNVVQEKAKMERSASGKLASPPPSSSQSRAPIRRAPAVDLFGDDSVSPPERPNTGPPMSKPPPKAQAAPPKQTKPTDSLLGLDFFGGSQAAPPPRPSSTTAVTSSAAPSRPDLKQSILSLYASKPATASQPQQNSQGGFGALSSAQMQSPTANSQQSAFGGLQDAFSGMNFSSPSSQQPSKPSAFSNLGSMAQKSTPAPATASIPLSTSFGGGGGFFDTTSAPPLQAQQANPPAPSQGYNSNSGFGDFFSSTSPAAMQSVTTKSQSNGNFDFMGGGSIASPTNSKLAPTTASYNNSAFNLSNPAPSQTAQSAAPQPSSIGGVSSNFDAWGSTEAWGDDSTPSTAKAAMPTTSAMPIASNTGDGWGSFTGSGGFVPAEKKIEVPKVSADEDFGDWGSAAPVESAQSVRPVAPPKPAGGFSGGGDDLFGNVWG